MAADDAHQYLDFGSGACNPGLAWVVVRARYLTPESIVTAMEAGDFYASIGVRLKDI